MKSVRLLCLAIAIAALCTGADAAGKRPFNDIVVFGHSHNDNGNDFILTGGIVAAPPYFGGRLSNGPLWVEWLAHHLGFRRPTERNFYPAPSEAGGTCYAYGGADTGGGFSDACLGVGPNKVCAPNVGLQIELFFADGRILDGNELIVLYAGRNDASPRIAARNMGEHVATLAAAGGKFFLVSNEGRVSQSPGGVQTAQSWDQFIAQFNAELANQLDAVEAQYDITVFRFDLLALTDALIADPAAFGLTNITDPACPDCGPGIPAPGAEATVVPNPDEYLYWDTAHYTGVVHELWGKLAADLVRSGN
jgi:phospholipase/lecithinase/hemolysin